MLTRLITLLENAPRGLSLAEISRVLGAQPAAVAGMLDWLARTGRLTVVGPDGGYCAACGLEGQCNLLVVHGKRYLAIPRASLEGSAPDGRPCSESVVRES